MLWVACVRQGEAYSAEYVTKLFDMVRRNLPDGFAGRFVCFTDRPADLPGIQTKPVHGLQGWWAKMALFAPDSFPPGDRVLYFDLDTCIVGPLDEIAQYEGEFAILRDAYRPKGLQSSVMAWEAGSMDGVWDAWNKLGWPDVRGGDQAFLEDCFAEMKFRPDLWQALYPKRFRSYKEECRNEIPKGTSVVFFHGIPRPHQVLTGWVPDIWRIGGGGAVEFVSVGTISQDKVLDNVRSALKHDYPVLDKGEPVPRLAVICGGGPSLEDELFQVGSLQAGGAAVFSVNQVDHFLREKGILPNFHVMVDARPQLAAWVNEGGIKLYASMCDPEVLAKGDAHGELTLWHSLTPGIEQVLDYQGTLIGGGCTVGTRALVLAYVMGFRRLLCVGFDSSYRKDAHHAYTQDLNDNEAVLDVVACGKHYRAAGWMVEQAQQFKEVAETLRLMGCDISVMGEGLLPTMFATLSGQPNHADLRAKQILAWLEGTVDPVGVEVGVFAGDLSARLLQRPDLTLYMVDSWTTAVAGSPYAAQGPGDFHAQLSQAAQDTYYCKTRDVVTFAGLRAKIMRADSVAAATTFADESLDFVFIDADHSYEGCAADIDAWLPKVKATGFISGHDYDNTDYPDFGVKRAVDEHFGAIVALGDNFTWRVRMADIAQPQRTSA